MTVAVLCVRCPDGVVRWPLAAEADEQTRRKLVRKSGTKGQCADGCPGGRHGLETYLTEARFVAAHREEGRAGPPVDPSAETRPWTPKRVPPGSDRACPGCGAASNVTAWVRDRCPACGGRFR